MPGAQALSGQSRHARRVFLELDDCPDMIDNDTSIPASISAFLKDGARAVTIAGAEPVFAKRGDVAFLMLHGWCASAESLRYLIAGIAEAGYSVLAPTLPGHGTSAALMADIGPLDWIEAARHALRLMADEFGSVYVLGVSMGGALALQLAALDPALIAGTITVNAPISLENSHFARDLMSGPAGAMLPPWTGPAFMGPSVAEITYPERSRKSGIDLQTMTVLAREALPLVTVPLIVIQSINDHIVPKSNATEIVERAGSTSKSIAWIRRSYHISQLDLDADEIVRLSIEFVSPR